MLFFVVCTIRDSLFVVVLLFVEAHRTRPATLGHLRALALAQRRQLPRVIRSDVWLRAALLRTSPDTLCTDRVRDAFARNRCFAPLAECVDVRLGFIAQRRFAKD